MRKLLFTVSAFVIFCSCSKEVENNTYNPETPETEVEVQDVTFSDPEAFLPVSSEASPEVDCINVERLSKGDRLMVLSLQGLVNRDKPRIYTHMAQDKWVLDAYRKNGHITSVNYYGDAWSLLEKYKSYATKAVICNPDISADVNLATNIAGVQDRIIISKQMADKFKSVTSSFDVLDLNSLGLVSSTDKFKWYKKNIYPHQTHSVLSVAKGGLFLYDVYRDYLVEFKIPVFWLPSSRDFDYSSSLETEVIKLLRTTPNNIPVLGFWQGVDESGKDIGYYEYDGVKLAGLYGKCTLVNTWVGNFSYHTGIRPFLDKFVQKKNSKKLKYDPTKKYVALTMNESGDAPCYFLYQGFFPRQWNDPQRGTLPLSYGISPSLRYLIPGVLEEMYKTQTENDYFFCSISGAGYCYPFEGYASKTFDQDKVLEHYYSKLTSYNMKQMDLDKLAIYTHVRAGWSANDELVADRYISTIPGLKTIVSGMHRTAYTGANAALYGPGNIPVFHTITKWSPENFVWNDEKLDNLAAVHMINDIKAGTRDGNFFVAMFYSWHYGPRRLSIVRNILEGEGYVFVTLDQLNDLYRQAN